MSTRARTQWVDIGKYICIMCVMISHLQSNTILLTRFFDPFFLNLFFFLSGYVYKQPKSFKEHMIKKFKGLFVPWLIFGHFNIILSAIISLKGDNNLFIDILWNWFQINGKNDRLWFVAALFVAFIPFYFVIKYMKTKMAIVVSIILSFISILYSNLMDPTLLPWGSNKLPWHIEYIFQAMLWMILGYYFKLYWEDIFDRWNKLFNRCVISIIYICLIILPSINNICVEILLSYLKTIVGIILIISVCKICKGNKYINYIGANTLICFALHGKIFTVLEFILGKCSLYKEILSNMILSSAFAVIMGLLLSVLLIIPIFIINKYLPWILGRKRA